MLHEVLKELGPKTLNRIVARSSHIYADRVADAFMNNADCLDESKNKTEHLGIGPTSTADEVVTKYLEMFEGLEVPLPHVEEAEAEDGNGDEGHHRGAGVGNGGDARPARRSGLRRDGLDPNEWDPVWSDEESLATAIRQRTTVIDYEAGEDADDGDGNVDDGDGNADDDWKKLAAVAGDGDRDDA
jgi:hypothetical protein